MWSRLVARLVIRALNRTDITIVDRNLLTVALLDKLQASPLHAIIDVDEKSGEMLVQGRPLDIEKGRQLMDSARGALRNQALNLIREQVKYEAFVGAAIKSATIEDLTFYRAALWWGQEIERLLKLLAQRNEEPDL